MDKYLNPAGLTQVLNDVYAEIASKAPTSHSHAEYLQKSGGTMTGALKAANNTNYTTAQVRNCTMSTSAPSGGGNGDIHFTYTA